MHARVGPRRHDSLRGVARALLIAAALSVSASACASNEGGGAAGMAAPSPLGVGEVCAGGLTCKFGLVCSHDAFLDQCSVQCNSNASCQQFDVRARCLGGPPAECAIACPGTCPDGTTCAAVNGGMACKLAR